MIDTDFEGHAEGELTLVRGTDLVTVTLTNGASFAQPLPTGNWTVDGPGGSVAGSVVGAERISATEAVLTLSNLVAETVIFSVQGTDAHFASGVYTFYSPQIVQIVEPSAAVAEARQIAGSNIIEVVLETGTFRPTQHVASWELSGPGWVDNTDVIPVTVEIGSVVRSSANDGIVHIFLYDTNPDPAVPFNIAPGAFPTGTVWLTAYPDVVAPGVIGFAPLEVTQRARVAANGIATAVTNTNQIRVTLQGDARFLTTVANTAAQWEISGAGFDNIAPVQTVERVGTANTEVILHVRGNLSATGDYRVNVRPAGLGDVFAPGWASFSPALEVSVGVAPPVVPAVPYRATIADGGQVITLTLAADPTTNRFASPAIIGASRLDWAITGPDGARFNQIYEVSYITNTTITLWVSGTATDGDVFYINATSPTLFAGNVGPFAEPFRVTVAGDTSAEATAIQTGNIITVTLTEGSFVDDADIVGDRYRWTLSIPATPRLHDIVDVTFVDTTTVDIVLNISADLPTGSTISATSAVFAGGFTPFAPEVIEVAGELVVPQAVGEALARSSHIYVEITNRAETAFILNPTHGAVGARNWEVFQGSDRETASALAIATTNGVVRIDEFTVRLTVTTSFASDGDDIFVVAAASQFVGNTDVLHSDDEEDEYVTISISYEELDDEIEVTAVEGTGTIVVELQPVTNGNETITPNWATDPLVLQSGEWVVERSDGSAPGYIFGGFSVVRVSPTVVNLVFNAGVLPWIVEECDDRTLHVWFSETQLAYGWIAATGADWDLAEHDNGADGLEVELTMSAVIRDMVLGIANQVAAIRTLDGITNITDEMLMTPHMTDANPPQPITALDALIQALNTATSNTGTSHVAAPGEYDANFIAILSELAGLAAAVRNANLDTTPAGPVETVVTAAMQTALRNALIDLGDRVHATDTWVAAQ